jgi:hypothetical protein
MTGEGRLPISEPGLMQRRGRVVRQRPHAAKPWLGQRLERQQHRRRLIALAARLLREDRQRARFLEQGLIAPFVGRLCGRLGQIALFTGGRRSLLGKIALVLSHLALFGGNSLRLIRERLLDLSLIALMTA